jgi:hypothetical protein
MRWALMVAVALAACGKKDEPEPEKIAIGNPDEGGKPAEGVMPPGENMRQLPARTEPPPDSAAPVDAAVDAPEVHKDPYALGPTRLPGRKPTVPRLTFGTNKVTGALPPEVVRRIIKQHQNQLQYCYEKTLRDKPELKGEAIVHFTIAASGAVAAADTKKSIDPDVDTCLADRFRQLEFPRPEHGVVEVEAPLTFSASN